MKLLHYGQPLFAPVNDGTEGSGAGTGSPAAFDPAAFSATLMAEFAKANTAFAKTLKADLAKQFAAPAAAAPPNPDPDPATSDTSGAAKLPADPALAATIRAMERRLKESDERYAAMKTESDATKATAEKKELDATVRTKLNKFKFADEFAAQDAFEIFGAKIKRNDEGAFVGNDGTPIDQFLEEGMRSKPYLLAPKDTGGAGARQGGAHVAGKAASFESIKPGMSAAEVSAAAAEISAVLLGQR